MCAAIGVIINDDEFTGMAAVTLAVRGNCDACYDADDVPSSIV